MNKYDLIGLLNERYLANKKYLQVYYGKQRLFYAKLGEKIILNGFAPKTDFPINQEKPEYQDFLLAFQAAGLLKWKNYKEIKDKLKLEIKRNKDKEGSCISFDTCFLRSRGNRVIRTMIFELLRKLNSKVFLRMPIAEGVEKELSYIDFKYKKQDLILWKLPEQWAGQPNLSTRKLRIGNYEYKRISKSPVFKLIPGDKGDENIIASLKKHGKNSNLDVLFLTEDNNCTEMALNEGLRAILVEQQKALPRELSCDWEGFADLLYILAIIVGWIKLDKTPIYGIWPGKKFYQWKNQEIQCDNYGTKIQ